MQPRELNRILVKTESGPSKVVHYQEWRYEDSLSGRKVVPGMEFYTDMNGNRLNLLPDGTFQEPASGRLFMPA